jgi:hypothetical protein
MGKQGQMITLRIGDTPAYREGVSPLIIMGVGDILAIIKKGRNPIYGSVQYSSMVEKHNLVKISNVTVL